MKSASVEAIKQTLYGLGIKKDDNVFIHSSLFSVGKIDDVQPQDIPKVLLSCFETVIGNKGSIFMPCFNYDFPKTRHADLTIQETTLGFWPEWFRKQKNVVRSAHPMFSICGAGASAHKICQPERPELYAFGQGSTYDRLIESDSVLVLQGIGLRVATVVVQIEAMLGLPYRFNKPFFGQVTLSTGQTIEDNFYHFCFPLNNAYREDYAALEASLLSSGVMLKKPFGRGFIFAVRMKALYEFIKNFTKDDPFALLNCRPQYLYRFENGSEIAYTSPIK
ncbi:AAC(3) family N-acetyltransferase [Pseudoalteromonas luteoviolacea]|uniref:Aminoglycoside N(3)-acetyltransferase n=1 Tax=Pseudoalteromonas luteoviolacea S4054 TaxID=1129367 RepID=A0A0F6A7Z1_9GAMM|nr:AAC(3) family N-acetyltransferase [Pseudoalteromonas luteoviolacea]AOT07453.1 hypothetical protein S4054249_06190 [Pseudoalteromonas luteoviolacea]AOT12369.1 hypothetical protein S40542_06190 [Pseudoalteromonas luteoviolacea]AOT17282.1 hypothetical protein S4054_06190 [Pseudoalteromonas luteoviolacea]KKE81966.1 hypothetical protein N479_20325 [Pseudoalteromonas luteoviolacea S4054]KZN74160.1 hypothetical protein N481_09270 [Pseudoalteromonas luteoviolacea S4047-1]